MLTLKKELDLLVAFVYSLIFTWDNLALSGDAINDNNDTDINNGIIFIKENDDNTPKRSYENDSDEEERPSKRQQTESSNTQNNEESNTQNNEESNNDTPKIPGVYDSDEESDDYYGVDTRHDYSAEGVISDALDTLKDAKAGDEESAKIIKNEYPTFFDAGSRNTEQEGFDQLEEYLKDELAAEANFPQEESDNDSEGSDDDNNNEGSDNDGEGSDDNNNNEGSNDNSDGGNDNDNGGSEENNHSNFSNEDDNDSFAKPLTTWLLLSLSWIGSIVENVFDKL